MEKHTNYLNLQAYGDVSAVLTAFKNRAQDINQGKLSTNKISQLREQGENVLCMPGSGQSNTSMAGISLAFDDHHLRSGVDLILGNSSGAAVGYYFIAGIREAGNIFYDHNVKGKLVKFGRHPILNISTLATSMDKIHPVHPTIFRDLTITRLRINVTHRNTGENVFFEASKVENPLSLVLASSMFPLLTGLHLPGIEINGETYIDGGISRLNLVEEAIEGGAKNIMLITTNPINWKLFYSQTLISFCEFLVKKGYLPGALAALAKSPRNLTLEFKTIRNYISGVKKLPEGVSLMVIAPTNKRPVNPFSMNQKVLQQAQVEAREFMSHLIQKHTK